MQDERKTKTQLVRDLRTLRAKLKRLEKSEEKRRHLVDELSESEEQYRSLIEAAPDVVYTISEDGSLTSLNPAFERITGWSRAEWLGKPFMGIVHPDDVSEAVETFQKALRGERLPHYQLRILSKSGEYLVGEFTTTPFVKSGNVVGELGIGRDITERKQAETALAMLLSEQKSIMETIPDIVFVLDLNGNVVKWNRSLEKVTGYSSEELLGKPTVDFFDKEDQPVIAQAIREAFEKGYNEVESPLRRKDGVLVPYLWNGAVLRDGKGSVIGITGVGRDLTERKRAEEMQQATEKRFRALIEKSSDVISLLAADGTILYVSPAAMSILGYAAEELKGRNAFELVHPDDLHAITELFAPFVQTPNASVSSQFRFRHKDGSWRWLDVVGTNLLAEPSVQAIIVNYRDITERKRTEEDLKQSEAQCQKLYHMIRLICNNVPDLIWAKDLQNNFIFTNSAMCEKLLGAKDSEEPIGKTDMYFAERERIMHPDQPDWHNFGEICMDSDSVVLSSRRPERFNEFGNALGQFLYLDVHKAPFLDEKGNMIGTVGCGRDVTREKQLEEQHKRAEEELALLGHTIRSIGECVSVTDPDNKILFVNDAFLKTYGYTRDDLIGKPISIVRSTTTEPPTHEILRVTLQGSWQGELVNRKKDGAEFPIALSTSVVRNEKGQPIALVGIAADITERKRAEEAIQKLSYQNKLILDSLGGGVYGVDVSGKATFVNPATAAMTGYTTEELVGQAMHEILHYTKPDGTPYSREECPIYAAFKDGVEHRVMDEVFWRKDGTSFPVEYVSTPIQEQDKLTGAVVIFNDITERKRAEAALRASEAKYRDLVERAWDAIFVVDRNGTILLANTRACELLGCEREEALKMNIADTYLVEERDVVGERIALAEKGEHLRYERAFVRKDGAVIPVEVTIGRLPDGTMQGIMRDITERKRTEHALRESEALLKAVMDNLPLGVAVNSVDPSVDFGYMNDNFPKFYRTTRQALAESDAFWSAVYEEPEFRETMKKRVLADIASGDPERMLWSDVPITRRGEPPAYITAKNTPILDGSLMISTVWDVTERKQTAVRLMATQEQLHKLAGHLQSVREEERKHISQEFHDQLGQILTALKMDLSMLQRTVADPDRELSRTVITTGIESLHGLTDRAIGVTREIVSELRPELLDQLGIVPTLEWEAEKFQRHSGISCTFSSTVEDIELDAKKSIALYRIFQEAVTNVARHAKATCVEIVLRKEHNDLILEIKDNGVGISPGAEQKAHSFGLIGMRERAVFLGGTLDVRVDEGKGTTILVRTPFEQPLDDGGAAV